MKIRSLAVSTALATGIMALAIVPAQAATLSVSVYKPPATPAGSTVTIKAKATPGSLCAIGITGVLSYGYRKHPSSAGNVSWTPKVPSSATRGNHSVKVSCIKSGKRITKYTTLYVKRWITLATFSGYGSENSDRSFQASSGPVNIYYDWSCAEQNGAYFYIDWASGDSYFTDYHDGYQGSNTEWDDSSRTRTARIVDGYVYLDISAYDNCSWNVRVTGLR
jgi:hypothetical protein